MMKKIKVGLFGCNIRGQWLVKDFMRLGCEIVAVCDNRKVTNDEILKIVGKDCPFYSDFDTFIEQGMDVVILCNFFHEHAPYAIKCMEKNIHVFSECISNGTMAEGVQLARAAKNSKSIYFLAENYPEMIFNREMKRVCDSGTLGKILYAEGEYNHPGNPYDSSFAKDYTYSLDHWRNFSPRTYYITHSIGPIMKITGATPKRVTAFAAFAPVPKDAPTASHVGDKAAIITTQNDDGSIFRVTGCAAFGAHHNSYRICGTEGQIENLRGMGNKVMLRYNGWSKPEGKDEVNLYEPAWNDPDEAIFKESGHGGGDYLTARIFIDCIREGRQPEHPYDLHSAINMASVAMLAHRSMLSGGMPYDIPDFRNEEDCKKYENDYLSPFADKDSENFISCCSHPDYKPSEEQIKKYLDLIK